MLTRCPAAPDNNQEKLMKVTVALILASLCALPAFASESSGSGHNGPCRADVERLCPNIEPGAGHIRACLREHKDDISDACKAKMQERRKNSGTEDSDSAERSDGDDK